MNYEIICCPECKKKVNANAFRCICGWKVINQKEIMNYNLGCTRMLGGKNCGGKIIVHRLCEECYEETRPKNDVEKKFYEVLSLQRSKAVSEGCVTTQEIGEWSRRHLGLSAMGRIILKNYEKSENENKASEEIIF